MSVNYRGWKWLDEDSSNPVDHDETVAEEVERLARKWSEIHHRQEQRQFALQAAMEDGDPGPEPDPCPSCEGLGSLGIVPPSVSRHGEARWLNWCGDHACPNAKFGILCPECQGDGFSRAVDRSREKRFKLEQLELESIEAALAHHGARMARPYEHWNEDEQYMQYMEEGRFGYASS